MPISSTARDCLKAATALSDEDTARFVSLHDGYVESGMGAAEAARKAAMDLVAVLRAEAGDGPAAVAMASDVTDPSIARRAGPDGDRQFVSRAWLKVDGKPTDTQVTGFGQDEADAMLAMMRDADEKMARVKAPAPPAAAATPAADTDPVLDDELRDALGKLGDVLGDVFGSKLNITGQQYTAGDLLPALSKVVELLVRKGFKSFRGSIGKAAQIMRADPRTAAHVDAISARQWRAAYNAIADAHDGTDSEAVVGATTADDVKAIVAPVARQPAAPAESLSDVLDKAIASGNMPKDNPALRKLVEQADGQPATPERMKIAQETLEAAIVRAARVMVEKGADERATFDALLALYQSQPNLNIRTSTSIDNQAYSTPAPLAYLGARLAGIGPRTKMYEPTGGNGMLAITAKPANVTATELDSQRFEALKAQGINVTQGDALEAKVPAKSQDAVHTNPPFGPIKNPAGESIKVKVDGYTLGQIDHLIAARALETMKDDGTATLIIGANKIAGEQSNNDLIFFNWLYGHYNVTSHFEVEGDLYSRQGASWPVRVITIHGRAESSATAPKPGTIGRANTWEEVYERFKQGVAAQGRAVGDGNAVVGARSGAADVGRAVPVDAGGQTRRTDPGRPEGGAPRAGDVAGGSAGTVGDRAAVPDRAVGDRAGSVGPDDAPAGGDRRDRPLVRAEAGQPAGDSGTAGVGNQFQAAYVARSARKDEGVLIPVNMAQPTQDALSRLEDEVGDIDAFAVKELVYKDVAELHGAMMGLQVDSVASAIYQIKNGKGAIISDQTGIGKGRQAAAIIRWAAKQGHIPVFVTVKPSLFTDMHGDLADIGSNDIAPFIVNSAESIKGSGDEKLFANKPGTHKLTLNKIVETAALPAGRNAVFMTYSQINVQNTQRDALLALASRHPGGVVFVLDESHNAGGDSATGDFIKEVLDLSEGVTYLSATYAKRPDNMPVYFKTDIGEAVADDNTLMAAMEAGGLPLQTVVANNLVKAGQMFRRERSYDGVNIESRADSAHRAEHVKMSDSTTLALRAIVHADRTFHENYVKALQKELEEAGGRVLDMAGNQARQSVDHTQFSSVVHNFVRQMLLGLKAQEAADDAIRSLKRGEKPLIAVENTMGSFLAEYAENNSLKVGDELGAFDYRTVLSRALERSRYIIRQLPNGDKVREYIPMGKLDPLSFEAYTRAQKVIDGLQIDIPVSPIDWMRNEITKAGFTVAEVTGRNLSVDYSGRRPKLDQIDQREQKDKVHTTRQFNGGKLDALILNVAGSTGISLHASEKFTDQRQRHMIVAQAAQDINIFMQMLGRVHRTGQVNLPKYTILSADLPAEIRPTALLSGKMKSLNANTSSNTESATSVKASDMLNKYGDQIVGQYLADNPELARELGLGGSSETVIDMTRGGAESTAFEVDVARKATGRLALMPVQVQEQFYAEVEEQYQSLMDYLNKTNQNDLEPRTFDLDAKETKSALLFEGQNKASPFGEDAIYGEYSIKAQGKAMTPDEIKAAMAENLAGKSEAAHSRAMLDTLQTAYDAYFMGLGNGDPSKQAPLRASADQVRRSTVDFIGGHRVGTVFRVDINGDTYNAIVTNIRSTHKVSGNPFSLSKVQVTVALNGALRSITVPATQFSKIEVSVITGYGGRIDSLFKVGPPNERETAKIVTGNLLGAYGELNGTRGSIITFTKGDGTTDQGILLPKSFNFANDVRQDYRLKTAADAVAFLTASKNENIDRFGVNSRDQTVRVLPHGKGGVTIQVPKSKLKGGKFFLNPKLRAIVGDFYSVGSFMRANVAGTQKAEQALDVLMQMTALYTVPSMTEEARTILNDPAPQAATPTPADAPPKFSLGAQQQASTRVQADVDAITSGWANAPEVVVAFDMTDPKVPAAARTAYSQRRDSGAAGAPEGFFLDGKVYLIASALKTPADTARVLMHEALGHAGLRGVFGPGLNDVLDRFAASMPGKVAAKAKEYGLDVSNTEQRRQAAEEALAELAQTRPTLGSVQRLIAAVRQWLREHIPGFGRMKMSDAEVVQQYIAPARGWVERGRGNADGPARFSVGQALPPAITIDGQQRSTTNSKGQAIAATEEGVRNFWKWFADSRVVDADGRPLVVYHGTAADFDMFNPKKVGSNYGADRRGFFFADDPDHAEVAAFDAKDAANRKSYDKTGRASPSAAASVMPVYLRVESPLTVGAGNGEQAANFLDTNKSKLLGRVTRSKSDGLIVHGADGDVIRVVFDPNQIKSATGNSSAFDPASPSIRFSLGQSIAASMNNTRDVRLGATYKLGDLMDNGTGKLGWWHKSIGTMHNLAKREPLFRRVFDAANDFINDVSWFATEAANLAPSILPKLETWKDLLKSPLSAADAKAVGAPVFEGTLSWARDKTGTPVKVDDLISAAGSMSADDKAREMVRAGKLAPSVLKMWQGLPLDQFEAMVASKYEREMLTPGVVWTDGELKSMFKLTVGQIKLYREFRAATDKSLTNLAIADMVRFAGKDAGPIRDQVLAAKDVNAAALLLRDHFFDLATQDPARADVHNDTGNRMIDKSDKAQRLIDRGYAPLMRFGNLTLDVVDAAGERLFFSLYESRIERAVAKRKLAEQFPGATITEGTTSEEQHKLFQGVTPETLELFGDMIGLEAQGSDTSSQLFQQYLKLAKSNRSALKRMIHRKGTAGFSEDFGRVLAGFVYSNARMTSRNLHQGEMLESARAIPQGQGELQDAAIRLTRYVSDPVEEAPAIKGLIFANFLGGSIASAMVNATQPFTVAMPYLSQWGGIAKAGKRMAQATKDALNRRTGDAALDKALAEAEEKGIVSPQEVHQLIGQAAGKGALISGDGTTAGDAWAKAMNTKSRIVMGWGKVFSVPEQFNRRTTFIAAYRTAVQEGLGNPAEFAEQAINDTMFIYSKANRPQWARGFVGSLAFTFKTFSISYVELLHRMATQGGPEGKRAALYSIGVLFLLAGAQGLPGADDLDDIIDGALQRLGYNWDSKQRKRELIAGFLGEGGADFMLRGISGLPGSPIDVSGRMGLGNLVPGTGLLTKKKDYGRDVAEIAGPAATLAGNAATGLGRLVEGNVGGAFTSVLPVAAQNMAKAVDMAATGMYRDQKGRKVIDTDATDAIFKAIGFQPSAVKRVQEATGMVQQGIALNKLRETEIADLWAQGRFEKDAEKVADARAQLAEWNRDNPHSPINISGAQIIRRLREMNLSKTDRLAKTAPKEIRAAVRAELESAQ